MYNRPRPATGKLLRFSVAVRHKLLTVKCFTEAFDISLGTAVSFVESLMEPGSVLRITKDEYILLLTASMDIMARQVPLPSPFVFEPLDPVKSYRIPASNV